MTPDEGLNHAWILEGNFNKVRPRTRPVVKKTTDSYSSADRQTNGKSGEKTIQREFTMFNVLLLTDKAMAKG